MLGGEVATEVAIEELHTGAEGILRTLVGPRGNWPTLLKRADRAGLLTPGAVAKFGRFNAERRNRLKHQCEVIPAADMDAVRDLMDDVMAMIEHLGEGRFPVDDPR